MTEWIPFQLPLLALLTLLIIDVPLDSNGYTGNFPSQLGLLTSIQELKLSGNEFTVNSHTLISSYPQVLIV